MNKLIILDRDGVINEDSDEYVKSVDEWIPIPGSIEAITDLSRAGYQVVIATNQSGLARGYFSESELLAMHQKMIDLVESCGGVISTILFCPHGPDDQCNCRKPEPGMIIELCQKYSASPAETWVIGDSLRDLQAGKAGGCMTALVRTGKGEKTFQTIKEKTVTFKDTSVFNNLKDFTDKLLSGEV